MSSPYIPNKDADAVAWCLNFSTLITANPALYGLLASDATSIATQVNAFNSAYTAAVNPSTRTTDTVAAKDAAKAAALTVCRGYAQTIKRNQGVSNDNKAALGIHLNDPTPTPVPPPATSPIITIIAATPLQHTLRFADQNTPASRAKPQVAAMLELRAVASATVVSDPAAIPFYGMVTRQPVAVDWSSGDAGKTAYFAARWINKKGEPGPWSTIVTFTVANG